MPDWLTPIISFTKQATPALFAIALSCLFALFADDALLEQLGVLTFRNEHRSILGFILLFSGSIIITRALFSVGISIQKRIIWRKNLRRLQAVLHHLKPEEKGYLIAYILDRKVSQKFREDDGIKGSLVAKQIIYRASNMGDLVDGWDYNINPWADDYLTMHPELLEGHAPIQIQRYW